jgi:phosphate butyryltransferase
MSSKAVKLDDVLSQRRGGATFKEVTVAVPGAHNPEIIGSIGRALATGFASFRLIGDADEIRRLAQTSGLVLASTEVIDCADEAEACRLAAEMACAGTADVLMKGLVQTSTFVRSILAPDLGLVPEGGLISHVALFDLPAYAKLLLLSDAAIVVAPDVEQRIQIIKNVLPVTRSVGIERPKIACIAPAERISEKVRSTGEAAEIVARVRGGAVGDVEIDGPFGFDVAVDAAAAKTKGIDGPVAGDADVIIAPGLDTGNALYKALSYFGRAQVAGVVSGAKVPVVLTSRADSEDTKYASLRLAIAGATAAAE